MKLIDLESDTDYLLDGKYKVTTLVRCKDCKWWDGNDCKARDIDVVDVDDYCSYGERRGE